MEAIVNTVIEKVTDLKRNTEEVILKLEVKAVLDDALKTVIRLKLKTHFTEDSVYFLTDSNYLIVDWSLNPPMKTKRRKMDINSNQHT
jgi:hypothetical protein